MPSERYPSSLLTRIFTYRMKTIGPGRRANIAGQAPLREVA
jgi:hypothetical protein